MNEIEQIYFNDFGVAFHWIKQDKVLKNRIQIVFKETGFYLTNDEVQCFSEIIESTCIKLNNGGCCCRNKRNKFLLKTPIREIDLAVSENELMQIKDLVEGTLFQIRLLEYLKDICRN